MKAVVHMTCVLVVGVALSVAGCSSKSVRSGGEARATNPNTMSDLVGSTEERLSPNVLYAKADPAQARRQLEEIRGEQTATAASGLKDVFFGYDSWTLSEEGRQILSRDAEWIRTHGSAQIKVEGHCDERGSSTYNLVLAEKRAKAVRNYLTDLGVKPERLSVVSYGKERPFCNEHAESCYQQNRRGHLVVKP